MDLVYAGDVDGGPNCPGAISTLNHFANKQLPPQRWRIVSELGARAKADPRRLWLSSSARSETKRSASNAAEPRCDQAGLSKLIRDASIKVGVIAGAHVDRYC